MTSSFNLCVTVTLLTYDSLNAKVRYILYKIRVNRDLTFILRIKETNIMRFGRTTQNKVIDEKKHSEGKFLSTFSSTISLDFHENSVYRF